ncbi:MAG: hypothetical protein INR64_15000 [Caulobacteraceae bacterium]|nr:hypothetical protein [Caulobacter sp.]
MTEPPNEVSDPKLAEAPSGPGPDLPPAQPAEDPGIVDDVPEGGSDAGGDAPI